MTEAVSDAADVPSDATLISAVRRGETAAYGALYERHVGAARRAAVRLVPTTGERDDLVAEAFTRVLRILRAGGGPAEGFRPYLLATMRNAMISWARRPTPLSLAEVPDGCLVGRRDDPVGTRLHASVAADAFASLPERWRMVLWHTEIEGESPAEIAPLLGMTPNSVAALAYRARIGLRQAYLEQYLPELDRQDCRAVVDELVGWVRNRLGARKMRRIAEHLDRCADCGQVASGLKQVNNELPAVVAPIILGAPLAVAYLSASGGAAISSGVSTISWLTAVKTVVASAAIVTTTAVTVVSDLAPPMPSDDGFAVSVPVDQPPPTTAPRGPDRVGSSGQNTKGSKKDAKQEQKAEKSAKHEAKQSAKHTKKEAKTETKPAAPKKQKSKR